MYIAITRQVSRSIPNCELSYLRRESIDVARARRQHAQYEAALKSLGLAVLSLPEEPDLPDAVFVEDTALVLDECAVITRSGAASLSSSTSAQVYTAIPSLPGGGELSPTRMNCSTRGLQRIVKPARRQDAQSAS